MGEVYHNSGWVEFSQRCYPEPWFRTFKPSATACLLQCFHFPKPPNAPKVGLRYGFGNVTFHTEEDFCISVVCTNHLAQMIYKHTQSFHFIPTFQIQNHLWNSSKVKNFVFTWKWAHWGYSKTKLMWAGYIVFWFTSNLPVFDSRVLRCSVGFFCMLFPRTCDGAVWSWHPVWVSRGEKLSALGKDTWY